MLDVSTSLAMLGKNFIPVCGLALIFLTMSINEQSV